MPNPYGGGRQEVSFDVAVIGIDGFGKKVDDHPNQPMTKRATQKIPKFRKSAEEQGILSMPFVASHNGQNLREIAVFICTQIEKKLMMEGSSDPRNRLYGNHSSYVAPTPAIPLYIYVLFMGTYCIVIILTIS